MTPRDVATSKTVRNLLDKYLRNQESPMPLSPEISQRNKLFGTETLDKIEEELADEDIDSSSCMQLFSPRATTPTNRRSLISCVMQRKM